MWNGLTSLLFGGSAPENDSTNQREEKTRSVLVSSDSDWILVDHKEEREMDEFLCDSVRLRSPELYISPRPPCLAPPSEAQPTRTSTLVPHPRRPYPARRVACSTRPELVLTRARSPCGSNHEDVMRFSRSTLHRSNRVREVQAGCRRQHLHNYDIRSNNRRC